MAWQPGHRRGPDSPGAWLFTGPQRALDPLPARAVGWLEWRAPAGCPGTEPASPDVAELAELA